MMTDYLLRFRQKTVEQLQTLQTELEAQQSIFSQQSMGTKSYTRDLRRLDDQLNAIAFVLREKTPIVINKRPGDYGTGITDFSNQPA